ncbi:hypothetical protein DE146DRAFT_396199 [Phaeosphaeria sp. MPI-PUGE-AT-0046c]|nr:hypothetical protein DE146DRAFT_396199 [Phaeosphaeria sp. MPI-PUGE-AT-0046c]
MVMEDSYPLQAAFQSSESSWSIYRGFSYLRSRVILELQDDIRKLEEELCDIENDSKYELGYMFANRRTEDCDSSGCGDHNTGGDQKRTILEKIRIKLLQYDDLLIRCRNPESMLASSLNKTYSFDPAGDLFDKVGMNNKMVGRKKEARPRGSAFPYSVAGWAAIFALVNRCHGRPLPGEEREFHRNFKERALEALTDNVVSCANLVGPLVFVIITSMTAHYFLKKRREGRAMVGMFGMAFIFFSTVSEKEGGEHMKRAVGLAYVCFMAAYCRLVVLRNGWKQGYCALAAALAASMVLRALSSSPVQTYLAGLTFSSAALVLSLAVPAAVFMCDVMSYLSTV